MGLSGCKQFCAGSNSSVYVLLDPGFDAPGEGTKLVLNFFSWCCSMSVYLSGAAYSCLGVVLAKPAGVSFVQPQGIFLNHPPEVNGSFAIDFEIKGFSKVN